MSALVARELSGLDRLPKEGACETDRVATGGAENAFCGGVRGLAGAAPDPGGGGAYARGVREDFSAPN